VSEDGSSWKSLPYFSWAQASGRAGHQVETLADGRSLVFGGLGGGRDILRSRLLAVVIEDIPPNLPQEEAVVSYLNKLLQEPGHLVLCVSSMPKLEADVPREGDVSEMHEESETSIYSLLQRWKFSELHVKPLEAVHLQKLCRRWTHGMELQEKVEAEMLLPDNYDLVNSPLMAIMVLRALAPRHRARDRHPLTRCQLYDHMFKRIFQSQAAVKAYDDSEFPTLQKQGMATACCELAYEGLGKRSRSIKAHELQGFIAVLTGKEVKVEPMERLIKAAHAGQLLLLEDYQQGGLRFRYPSMQDYLAAQCAWQHLLEGKGLPSWLIQENAAGNVSEEVTSCAKFFCLQAEGKEPLRKELLLELREGLAFLLQTMCKAGNALAIRCLLGIAAASGRQQLMAMHSQSGNRPTGLHLAAIHGHKDVVETLLALAPEPMQLCLAVNSDGMAPLHCAARDGHEATAKALLQGAPDGFSLLQMPQKSSSALRPLHWAAKQGHVEVVKCFLEFAPKPAVICVEANSAGNTALHFAAAGGHMVTCHAILTHAGPANELADRAILLLTAVNRFDRQTALHIAADRGEKEVVDTLLQSAPDRSALLQMSDKLGQTALHLACERGHGAVVKKLLQSGDANLVAARERITGQTALHMAAESGHTEAVRAILVASPLRETSLATDRGARNTALHLAAERGHLETVKTLVEHCPDTESLLMAQEKFAGQTALHLAAGAGHAELCQVLLELAHSLSSTLLSMQDKSGGFTPLQLACEKGHAAVIEVLLEGDPEKGSRLKETLEKWSGFTALHLVAYRGHEDAAKVMLRLAPDRRALLSFKDERGRTAGDLAMERGRRPVASLLTDS